MWVELLEVARWAPSPHNIQPWRLRVVSETEAELVCPADRRLPATDPGSRFTLVGLAVFVETLRVAAHARGRELDADWNGLGAHLRLLPGGGGDFDPRLVLERRTARGPYD